MRRPPPSHALRRVAALGFAVGCAVCLSTPVVASAGRPVQLRVLRLVDESRRAHFRNGTTTARDLTTYVRYPSQGTGPFPLIVFAHGFSLTPARYTALLNTWARAGYVVAAPVFPVESTNAPGGPDQSDLGNEPRDISFVISRLTAARSPVAALIDLSKIAVAGQSDGGIAALSVAYDRRFADRRIKAALVLSGAAPSGFRPLRVGTLPLLAVQGTLDPFNAPATTAGYYRLLRRPKFLLWLLGAGHLPPYTTNDRWAAVVDRATTAFLDHYLRGAPLRPLIAPGTKHGVAHIVSSP